MKKVLLVTLLCVVCFAQNSFGGCYNDRIGESVTVHVGDDFCLKNNKWKCQPFCFMYAGMIHKGAFSLVIPRQQGGANLFFPADVEKMVMTKYIFKPVKVTPEAITLEFLGELEKK